MWPVFESGHPLSRMWLCLALKRYLEMEGQRAEAAAGMECHGRRLWEPEENLPAESDYCAENEPFH